MKVLADISDLECDTDLKVDEVKAMPEYKDMNEDEISSVIETIRIFTELVYEIHASKDQGEEPICIASQKAGDTFYYDNFKIAA
jgi:predicted  nucleic acid-binding Zn-ribbon protein